MQRSTRYGLIVIAVCLLCAGLYLLFSKPTPTDQQLITAQLTAAVRGANAGSVEDVVSTVSANYKDESGGTKDDVRKTLIRVFQYEHNVRYTITNPLIQISGDNATAHFTLVLADRQSNFKLGDRDSEVDFKREHGYSWFIFPITTWDVVSSDFPSKIDLDQ